MKAFQKANVATLIGLLVAIPAEAYNHCYFGFGYGDEPEASGCALGLAMANADKFADEEGHVVKLRRGFVGPTDFAARLFGDAAWNEVFGLFSGQTKATVLAKLKAYGEREVTA